MMASLFNEEFMNYYDWKRYTIKPDAIKKRLKILRSNGFSDKFVKILASMLEVNDFQRIAVNELYNACEIGSRGGQNPTKQPDQMLRGSTPYSGGSFNNESYGQKKSPAQDLSMRPTYDASTVKSGQHSREDIISMLSKNQNRGSNQNQGRTPNALSTRLGQASNESQGPLGEVNQNFYPQKQAPSFFGNSSQQFGGQTSGKSRSDLSKTQLFGANNGGYGRQTSLNGNGNSQNVYKSRNDPVPKYENPSYTSNMNGVGNGAQRIQSENSFARPVQRQPQQGMGGYQEHSRQPSGQQQQHQPQQQQQVRYAPSPMNLNHTYSGQAYGAKRIF